MGRAFMNTVWAAGLLMAVSQGVPANAQGASMERKVPTIVKLGTIDCDLVEATPVVFHGRLYRFEYVREGYKPNDTGNSYFRFVDVENGRHTAGFAAGYHLGSAFADGDTMYVYGVDIWSGERVQVWWSKDLTTWETKPALVLPGWGIFNTSVCKGEQGYVMSFEIGQPPEETGVAFTMRFARSEDALNWELTPSECVYSKEKYTACPALRYLDDGYYYMIYLEAHPGVEWFPGPSYLPHIVRSRDLVTWEDSPHNPMMRFSDEDKMIANPNLTEAERARIAAAVDINNSDVDLCEFQGRTIIIYSWGNQQGVEHLAEAYAECSLKDFLQGYFPES